MAYYWHMLRFTAALRRFRGNTRESALGAVQSAHFARKPPNVGARWLPHGQRRAQRRESSSVLPVFCLEFHVVCHWMFYVVSFGTISSASCAIAAVSAFAVALP
jgi:hypothetical protein